MRTCCAIADKALRPLYRERSFPPNPKPKSRLPRDATDRNGLRRKGAHFAYPNPYGVAQDRPSGECRQYLRGSIKNQADDFDHTFTIAIARLASGATAILYSIAIAERAARRRRARKVFTIAKEATMSDPGSVHPTSEFRFK